MAKYVHNFESFSNLFAKKKFKSQFFLFVLYFSVILTVMSIITSVGAWHWLTDPKTAVVPLTESLLNHYIFVLAALILCKYFGLPIDGTNVVI